AQQVDHHHRLVGGTGQEGLDLFRGRIECHRSVPPFRARSRSARTAPHRALFYCGIQYATICAMATGVRRKSDPLSDGRVRRGERSGDAIVVALVELVGEGILEPTAQQVAARARVGMRTVFRRFSDMESLFAEMGARVQAEALPLLAGGRPRGNPM